MEPRDMTGDRSDAGGPERMLDIRPITEDHRDLQGTGVNTGEQRDEEDHNQ